MLKRLNLVEYFKSEFQYWGIHAYGYPKSNESYRKLANLGIDTFITFKWLIVTILWLWEQETAFAEALVWYLIISNIYTYFYYHAWDVSSGSLTKERSQRRFVNVLLSMAFSIFCYGYLYAVPYHCDFNLGIHNGFWDMIYFSTANSFTVTYGDVELLNTTARMVSSSQLAVTFIFVLIVASSIPTNTTK